MQAALESVDGVEGVVVSFEDSKATVTCETGCDEEALIAALEASDFGGTIQK